MNPILKYLLNLSAFNRVVGENEELKGLCMANPGCRFFGEWLVPHSLKTYREDAWRDFYIFDVMKDDKAAR